jgi:hypothetical protein
VTGARLPARGREEVISGSCLRSAILYRLAQN